MLNYNKNIINIYVYRGALKKKFKIQFFSIINQAVDIFFLDTHLGVLII